MTTASGSRVTTRPVAGVVVAAGSGERLGTKRPKAMIEVRGRPLWQWAAGALREAGCDRVVIVVPPAGKWAGQVQQADRRVLVVSGGATRQESVRLGLAALQPDPPDFVLVHDAARAMAPADVARRVINMLVAGEVAVAPAVPLADTVRQLGDDFSSRLLDRTSLVGVQTPQGAVFEVLARAHAAAHGARIQVTDDITLVERLRFPVALVDGDPEAFKITTPTDLALARVVAGRRVLAG